VDGGGQTEPEMPSSAGQPLEFPHVIETSRAKGEHLNLRDKIDLYLGWRPPAGTFRD
jgi:hypothetical protein